MPKPAINRDTVSGDALLILQSLKENGRLGRSNKLADVKAALEPSVSLEFDSYFFFLRKYHYIAMDREAQLRLTDQGERVVGGDAQERFTAEVSEFFAEQLPPPEETQLAEVLPSAPPPLLLDEDESLLPADAFLPPPPPSAAAAPPPPPAPASPPAPPASSRRKGSSDTTLAAMGSAAPAVLITPAAAEPPAEPAPRREPSTTPATAQPLITPTAPNPMPPSASTAPAASPAPAAPARGPEADQRYQRFDPLGSGPLGTVYKGRSNALGVDVCIKELKDIFGYFSFLQRGEVLKRLRKELCSQAQVRHPSVVQVLDQNMEAARPYFVVELLRGSLREQLDATGGKGVAVPFALRWFLQLAYGLRAAHASGLTHHNLKPENVLFDAYGNVKLSDFGMGRVVEVDATKGMPQVFVGTGGIVYMAPELLQRQPGREPGTSADVYGLGIVLYEMLTGQVPGRRSPPPSEANPECPQGLDRVFDLMTHDRLEQRYPDVDALLTHFYEVFPNGEYLNRGDLILSSEMPQ